MLRLRPCQVDQRLIRLASMFPLVLLVSFPRVGGIAYEAAWCEKTTAPALHSHKANAALDQSLGKVDVGIPPS